MHNCKKKARAVRRHIINLNANSPAGGDTGADLSQVELLTALYFRILNCAPDRLEDKDRDIYIQSKGHAVGCYYCVLAEAGYFPLDWLATYQHANSHLGHGLPVAGGLAIAAKRDNSPRRIFLITGDGELAEGSNWEAAMAAAHYQLDNLVIINDKNGLQLAGAPRDILNSAPLDEKWRAFGMEVSECDGNDMASVVAALENLPPRGKPHVLIAHTTKGAGVSFIAGKPEWHHRVPKGDEITEAMKELNDPAAEEMKSE